MKNLLLCLSFFVFFFGCAKDPKIVEQENKASLQNYIQIMDGVFYDIDKLITKVDSLNKWNLSYTDELDPNTVLIIRMAELKALDTLMSEIPLVLEPEIILKQQVASDFTAFFQGNYYFYEKIQNEQSVKYIPRDEINTLKSIVNSYSLISAEIKKKK